MRLRLLTLGLISALTMTACASNVSSQSNLAASQASEPARIQTAPAKPAAKVDPKTQADRTGLAERTDVQAFIQKVNNILIHDG